MADELELSVCSHCDAQTPLDELSHFGEDADFCPACAKAWQDVFNSCEHDWAIVDQDGAPYVDEYGDPARYCHKCGGMTVLEE